MDFSKRQADPRKHLAGITFVIAFHALIVYALVTGLAKKVVEVVIAPIETKVLEEVRKPPPPPEIIVPPPPKLEAPPPPFIPPPEVQITAPPPPAPTITAVTPTPPPAPVVITPAPPPPAPAPPAPPAPPPPAPAKPAGPVQAGIACSKTPQPEVAISEPVEGSIFVKATVKAGRIADIVFERDTLRGANTRTKRALRDSIETAMQGYVCAGDGVQVVQEFHFKIN